MWQKRNDAVKRMYESSQERRSMYQAWCKEETMQQQGWVHESSQAWGSVQKAWIISQYTRSTAFGSEYEKTTVTQTQPKQHASRAVIKGQEGSSVPGEVTIPFQDIVEV